MKKMDLRLMNLFLALAVFMVACALEAQNNTADNWRAVKAGIPNSPVNRMKSSCVFPINGSFNILYHWKKTLTAKSVTGYKLCG